MKKNKKKKVDKRVVKIMPMDMMYYNGLPQKLHRK